MRRRARSLLPGGRGCANNANGRHNTDEETRTLANGRKRRVVYCTRCGAEI